MEQYANSAQEINDQAVEAVEFLLRGYAAWYSGELVKNIAEQMAGISAAAQDMTKGLAFQYVSNVVAAIRGSGTPATVRATLPPIRGGLPSALVYTRPIEVYKRAIATGSTPEEALERAVKKAGNLAEGDLLLTRRDASQHQMKTLGVDKFRRIVHPELSKSGTCGLCIVASNRVYYVKNLMPIHAPTCKCEVLPIIGEHDPGRTLNDEDLQAIYDEAGSTSREDLRKLRVDINDDDSVSVKNHGEYGPTLVRTKDHFRGKKSPTLDEDPPRAKRMLEKAEPALNSLQQRASLGEDVSGPLKYQEGLVARLKSIVG